MRYLEDGVHDNDALFQNQNNHNMYPTKSMGCVLARTRGLARRVFLRALSAFFRSCSHPFVILGAAEHQLFGCCVIHESASVRASSAFPRQYSGLSASPATPTK
jgi:hypothetical protein